MLHLKEIKKKCIFIKNEINMLMIGPIAILLFATLLLSLVVTALALASKNKSNVSFIVWGVFILAVPFVGAVACILSSLLGRKKARTV
jgi:uncharacterized membrane protein